MIDPVAGKIVKGSELSAIVEKELVEDGLISWKSHQLDIKVSATRKMIQFGGEGEVETRLQQKIADAFAKKEGQLFIEGSGAGQARRPGLGSVNVVYQRRRAPVGRSRRD